METSQTVLPDWALQLLLEQLKRDQAMVRWLQAPPGPSTGRTVVRFERYEPED